MRVSFNVLEQGWIPVVYKDGSRGQLGIRQALAKAHELAEITDASPLKEFSMYRFLSLFLMDALRPEEERDIEDLLQDGSFDMDRIEQYIALCIKEGVSFDLFDEERPFLQSKYDKSLDGETIKPVANLDCTLPSGNSHVHFYHSSSGKIEPNDAIRQLLVTYWFCTAAAQGYPSGVYGAPPLFGIIKGENLFETLVFMLLPMDYISIPFDSSPVFWRRTAPVMPKKEVGSTSWLEGNLFPTRRVSLVYDDMGMVTGLHLCQGENYVNKATWRDPYVTYRSNETGFFPLRPNSSSPVWRNYCDIIDIPGNHASQVVRLYKSIHGEQIINLTLYGVGTNQASYLAVHRYDLVLPLNLAKTEYIALLSRCIAVVQNLRLAINKALRGVDNIPESVVSVVARRFDHESENRFWRLCREVDYSKKSVKEYFDDFCEDIQKYALQTYEKALALLNLRAHALAEAENMRRILHIEMRKIRKEES